jgi:N-acetylmuramoyl-L-alanine amidase
MIAFAYYLLKVIICSGILFFYYHFALRNKLFHQWNRFYLLATIVLSLSIPCLQFNIWGSSNENAVANIQLLKAVYSADEYVAEINTSGKNLSMEQWSVIIYSCISIVVLIVFILALVRIRSIVRSHSVMLIDDIRFVNTEEKDAPFSFLNYVFWNKQIELNSPSGEHIFQHELVHVREKHSFDKIFLQVILIGYWCNPFFWLIRKELQMIHEFIADKNSVGQSDAHAFAAMILQATYPTHYTYLTNQFFQSSIKRRLTMLTKKHNPKISYISRVLALPLFAFILFAFTVKAIPGTRGAIVKLEKEITVVIDAGHGGKTGARVENFVEDDLVLQIAKTIKSINTNDKIKVLLTRENENIIDLKERVEFTRKNNADLFISLHLNMNDPAQDVSNQSTGGLEVFIPTKNPSYQKQSEVFASALVKELSGAYTVLPNLGKHKTQIWVLDRNVCPSVMIECGYLNNKKDLAFISEEKNQKLIAEKILQAIEAYSLSQNSGSAFPNDNRLTQNMRDTTPVRITLNTETLEDTVDQNFLVIVDGVEKGRKKDLNMEKLIAPEKIASVNVFKGEEAIKKYGEKGKQGVVEIITKKLGQGQNQQNQNMNAVNIRNTSSNKNNSTEVQIRSNNSFENSNNQDNELLIIDGLEKGKLKDISKFVQNDQIKEVHVFKGEEAIKQFGDKGINGVIVVDTKDVEVSVNTRQKISTSNSVVVNVDSVVNDQQKNEEQTESLLIIDGKEIGVQKNIDVEKMIEPNTVKKVSVFKGEEAIKKYGQKAKNGVIEITTNKK